VKRFFREIVIVLALILLAIAPASPKHIEAIKTYSLIIDSDFSVEEEQAIYSAADMWTEATNGMIHFDFFETDVEFNSIGGPNVIWRASLDDQEFLIFEFILMFNKASLLGYAPKESFIILVPERADSIEHFQRVTAHELGHHIGLLHTPSIMNATSATSCITKHDLIQFCKQNECDPNDLKEVCIKEKPR